jgi:hypothetical protein
MNTLLFNGILTNFYFDSITFQVKVTVKTVDSIYFTEKVIFQRNISLYLFLPLFLLAMIPMLLFMIAASVWRAWDKLNLWLFSEKELISVEQARQQLAKNPFFENLTTEQKQQLFSKKDLPLGL